MEGEDDLSDGRRGGVRVVMDVDEGVADVGEGVSIGVLDLAIVKIENLSAISRYDGDDGGLTILSSTYLCQETYLSAD